MSIGLLFWIIMIFLILSRVGAWTGHLTGPYLYIGDGIFIVLLFLLGWKEFGFIIHA